MNNKIKITLALLLSLICIYSLILPCSAQEDRQRADEIAQDILDYNLSLSQSAGVQEFVDGYLSNGASESCEWYVLTLARYEEGLDFSKYVKALKGKIDNAENAGAVIRLKYALTLLACGDRSNPYIAQALSQGAGAQGIMSYIFALHLINNGVTHPSMSASDIIEQLISLQSTNGGWALTVGGNDPDVSAMVLQAMAPYCTEKSPALSSASKCLDYLSSVQTETGGFKSYGVENLESSAQVLLALTSLKIDPLTDSRFIKNGITLADVIESYRLENGSFSHTAGGAYSPSATVQAYYSLMSYVFFEDEAPFFIFEGKGSSSDENTSGGNTSEGGDDAGNGESPDKAPSLDQSASDSEKDTSASTKKKNSSYKIPVIITVGILCAGFALILLLRKKKLKDALLVICIGALVICLTLVTNFETVEDHYSASDIPVEYDGEVSLSILCHTVAGRENAPASGVILENQSFGFTEGESVYDLLLRVCKENRIFLDASSSYVKGIDGIYELSFDCSTSGWVYLVNGESPSVGCDQYLLRDGDTVVWHYTLNLGTDIRQEVDSK